MSTSLDDDDDDVDVDIEEEEEEEPHMLAVASSGGESLHDEPGDVDSHEEMILMHTKEAMGTIPPPPPPPEYHEPACFVEPAAPPANKPVDDSFESYIFDSDGDDDFLTRGKNHVIPVINSSPTKKRRPGSIDNTTDPSTSPQTPSPRSSRGSPGTEGSQVSPRGSPGKTLSGRKAAYADMYISPPSSSEYGASPREADGRAHPPQSAFYHKEVSGRAYSSPVMQPPPSSMLQAGRSMSPYMMRQSAPPSTHPQHSQPPTIPDGKTPIVLETPNSYRQQPSEKSKTVVLRSMSAQKSGKGYTCGMRTPVFWVLSLYLIFVTACFIYFAIQYAQSASLRDQVDQLSAEVDQLSAEVDQLSAEVVQLEKEVGDLGDLNNNLNKTVNDLSDQNEILNETRQELEESLEVMQDEVENLQGTVSNLTLANEEFKEQFIALNETNTELEALTENLTIVNDELIQENEALRNSTDELQEENEELRNSTDELQATLSELSSEYQELGAMALELQDEVTRLQEENNELTNLTEALGTVLSFLEEINEDASITAEELAFQLEQQITESRILVLENLQNTMIQRTQTWNCDYINAFAGASFVMDYSVPIETGSYDSVLDYVENRVLTGLCLDRADFELFLSISFMPNGDGLTSNELISGVTRYTTDALDYYFPDLNEAGVTPEEWAEAAYDCANFPPELQYRSDQ